MGKFHTFSANKFGDSIQKWYFCSQKCILQKTLLNEIRFL